VADASYSPRLRTALVLTGAGTAGAYQAGVLGALAEAGVKIDVIAAHGPGVANAVMASADGSARLWDSAGPWNAQRLPLSYRWRPHLRAAGVSILAALAVLLLPLIVLVVAAALYAGSLLAGLLNLTSISERLIGWYAAALDVLFRPPILPTVVPRLIVVCLLVTAAVLVVAWWRSLGGRRASKSRRRVSGSWWWQLFGAPIDAGEPAGVLGDAIWRHVRGASTDAHPAPAEVGRKYVDLLTENLGQPGFCEVVLAVHDLDARRDLTAAVLDSTRLPVFTAKSPASGPREAEALDLTTAMRDHVMDFVTGSIHLPGATAAHGFTFPVEHYWQGESHRVCDRPELVHRLVEEVLALGAEQIVFVSAAAPAAAPHALRSRPGDLRGRMGEWQRSVETAALDSAVASCAARFSGVFVIRPVHNAIGPFDFGGAYDEGSDRHRSLQQLKQQGYDDAYRVFVEPVVASGDRVDTI
jgi:hypothetical protein